MIYIEQEELLFQKFSCLQVFLRSSIYISYHVYRPFFHGTSKSTWDIWENLDYSVWKVATEGKNILQYERSVHLNLIIELIET